MPPDTAPEGVVCDESPGLLSSAQSSRCTRMATTSCAADNHRLPDALAVAEALCARRGRRFTPIRRNVLELLLRHQRSLKAYELLEEIRAIHPSATPPTVYRALDFLLAEGLVHRVDTLNTFIACGDADG